MTERRSGTRSSLSQVLQALQLQLALRASHDPASSAGVFDERIFRGLDWLIAEAARRQLRLILVLTNYWEVRWLPRLECNCARARHPLRTSPSAGLWRHAPGDSCFPFI